jgi:UbiD family decarboxylase
MNVVEKTGSNLRPNAVDFDRFRLRRFIESLAGTGELDTHNEPVDLAGIAEVMEGNKKAVLFRSAGPEKADLAGNVMGGRARIAAAFGVKPDGLLKEIQRRLRNKPDIFEVSRAEAPCQAVVLTGDDADVTRLPVHLQHGADGGPYISASIDYVIDPKTGWTNVGLRRLMLRSAKETGIDLVAPSDL